MPFLEEARAAPGFMVGRYSFGGISRKHALPVSVPVFDESENRIGFVASALDLGWLDSKLRERDFAQNSALTIADRDGTIIAASLLRPLRGHAHSRGFPASDGRERARDAGCHQPGWQPPCHRLLPGWVRAERVLCQRGHLPDEAFREIDAATWRMVLITIASLVAATAGAWLMNRLFVTRPVRHLVSTIQVWRAGQEDARTGLKPGASEFGRVGASIDAFMDELAERRRPPSARRLSKLLMGELQHA